MPKTTTALAFDFGLRSIGIAYGQSLTGTAKPLPTLQAKDGIPDWNKIGKLIEEWRPSILIIGLPLNMDDTESELSRRARKFGNRLHGRFNIPIDFMDERLSSFEVKQTEKEKGHKGNYKNDPIDSLAAQLILEDWFKQTTNRSR